MDHSHTKVTKHGKGGKSRGDREIEAGRSHHFHRHHC